MKRPLIFAIFALISIASAEANEQFITVSANTTIAGDSYSTPSATFKSGQKGSISYPIDQSEVVVSFESSIVNEILNYTIAASIPTEDGASKTEITSKGKTDKGKPIVFQFDINRKPYALSVTFTPTTREGEAL